MIARITIKDGRFASGYIRKGDDKLDIKNTIVEWPRKWQVTLSPDVIIATSSRVKGEGGNVVSFEVGLGGYSKLVLKTTAGECKLLGITQVFTKQRNLNGDLYLIYNSNGYRSAYFYSEEFLEWKKAHGIVNVLRKDPNEVVLKDRRATANSRPIQIDGLSTYTSGRLTTITDGKITLENKPPTITRTLSRRQDQASCVRLKEAKWAILEKARKNRIERVLITEEPVFELDLPDIKLQRIKRYSELGLELLSQEEA